MNKQRECEIPKLLLTHKKITTNELADLLCASNKIGRKYFHNLCTVKDISKVISDSPPPEKICDNPLDRTPKKHKYRNR